MRIVLATFPTAEYQGVVMNFEGAKYRLLSFVFTRQLAQGDLEQYAKNGFINKPKGKQ